MRITRRQLRRLVEMAVRQDILDAVSTQPNQRTTLLSGPVDLTRLTGKNNMQTPGSIKPMGLWYGFGTNWVDFIKDPVNQMVDRYAPEYFYKLDVATTSVENYDQNKVLLLETQADWETFRDKFGFQRVGGFVMGAWGKLPNFYGGIEISDDLVSTFGWDIRSGCVWNKAAIIGEPVPLQDPNVDQDIPRIPGSSASGASASTGSSISFNPDAQTIEEIGNQNVINLLKEYEYEVLDYEGEIQDEASSAYGENIYEKILEGLNINSNLWIKQAVDKIKINHTDSKHRQQAFSRIQRNQRAQSVTNSKRKIKVEYQSFGLAEKISLVFWIITNYDSSTGQLTYGEQEIIYSLPPDFDFDEALDTFNSLLQSASKELGLGISDIDLDYDGDWGNAIADMESRGY